MAVVDVCRSDVLVETGKFACDVVSGRECENAGFERVIYEIFAAVGQQAVGIGISCTPIEIIVFECMFTRKLSVVGRAAAIIVLGIFFVIVLRTDAGTVGIAVGTYLVEDVFELEAVVFVFGNERYVQQRTYAGCMVVLIVDTASQIIAAVVVGIVSAEHRIFHIEVGFETVAVIDGSDKTYFPSGRKAAYAAYIGAYAQIADRVHGAYLPVVVESVSLQVDTVAGYGFECGVHTTVEMAQTVVESQKVGFTTFIMLEVMEVGRIVDVSPHR